MAKSPVTPEDWEKVIQEYDLEIDKLRAAKKQAAAALEATLATASAKAALEKMSPVERTAALALLQS